MDASALDQSIASLEQQLAALLAGGTGIEGEQASGAGAGEGEQEPGALSPESEHGASGAGEALHVGGSGIEGGQESGAGGNAPEGERGQQVASPGHAGQRVTSPGPTGQQVTGPDPAGQQVASPVPGAGEALHAGGGAGGVEAHGGSGDGRGTVHATAGNGVSGEEGGLSEEGQGAVGAVAGRYGHGAGGVGAPGGGNVSASGTTGVGGAGELDLDATERARWGGGEGGEDEGEGEQEVERDTPLPLPDPKEDAARKPRRAEEGEEATEGGDGAVRRKGGAKEGGEEEPRRKGKGTGRVDRDAHLNLPRVMEEDAFRDGREAGGGAWADGRAAEKLFGQEGEVAAAGPLRGSERWLGGKAGGDWRQLGAGEVWGMSQGASMSEGVGGKKGGGEEGWEGAGLERKLPEAPPDDGTGWNDADGGPEEESDALSAREGGGGLWGELGEGAVGEGVRSGAGKTDRLGVGGEAAGEEAIVMERTFLGGGRTGSSSSVLLLSSL